MSYDRSSDGIIYAAELFDASRILPGDSVYDADYMSTIYMVDGTITNNFNMTFTLTNGATFADDPLLGIDDSRTGTEAWSISGTHSSTISQATGTSPALPLKPKSGTGSGKNTAVFEIPAGEHNDLNLQTGDKLLLLYNLNNTKVLSDPKQTIEMEVKLETALEGIRVNPTQKITIARSKQATVTWKVSAVEGGNSRISVLDESKEFSGDDSSTRFSFIDSHEVQIGLISLKIDFTVPILLADGFSYFSFKLNPKMGYSSGVGVKTSNSTLVIKNGQFAASQTLPGKVFIHVKHSNGITELAASHLTETSATWELTNDDLDLISKAEEVTIRIRVDGKTPINVPDKPPHATLMIDFDDTGMTDITLESDLALIKRNGTICTVYNVPGTAASEAISIRITNDSPISGKLTGLLFDMDGQELIPAGTDMLDGELIKPNETKRLTAADLEELSGGPWTGRALLTISSALPKLGMFALLRSKIPGAPLTNLSVGATGRSCEN